MEQMLRGMEFLHRNWVLHRGACLSLAVKGFRTLQSVEPYNL